MAEQGRAGQLAKKHLSAATQLMTHLPRPHSLHMQQRQGEARRKPDEVNIERPFQLTCDMTAQASCKVSSCHSAGADQREQGGVEAGARLAHDIG